MSFFWKKKDESVPPAPIDVSKVKDLNSEDRQHRKEPIKPWGKAERLTVLFTILITVGISSVLALSTRDWKLPGLPRIKMSGFSLPNFEFLEGKTIVIDAGKPAPEVKVDMKAQKIIRDFKETTNSLSGTYGLYVVRLDDGSSYGINEKEVFQAASLIKLPVFITLYNQAESGKINLDMKYTLKEADKIGGSGSLQYKPAGTVLTYRQLAQLMGKQSDNTAFGIIRKLLGDKIINDTTIKMGMNLTSLETNDTSPKDIGELFRLLWQSKLVSVKSRDEILGYMTDTIYESWLRAGIPDDIRVAHKYGREVHVINDAGIIYANRPFVLVLMSKGVVEKEGDDVFPRLVEIVYDTESD